jgi:pimeloyl-ACP methyl ester carboxylesterase
LEERRGEERKGEKRRGEKRRGRMDFTTVEENGVALSVRIFRPNAGVEPKSLTLILVHQYSVLGGCQGLLKGMANMLAAKGFTTITFDMRGAGRSSGRPSITGSAEVQDVIAVCKWAVDKLPAPSILLIGSSAGQRLSIFLQVLWCKSFCITICCSSSTSCFFLLLLLLLSPPFYFLLWCRFLTLVIVTHLQPQCLFFLLCTSLSANGHTQVLFLPH